MRVCQETSLFKGSSSKKILANLTIRFCIDNRGRVMTVETSTKLGKESWAMFPSISQLLSEKGIRQTLKQMLPVLPQTPLATGDAWDDTLAFNRPGSPGFQKVRIKYRYAGPAHYKNSTLEKITTEAILGWGETPPGVTVKVVSQKNPGVIYFDGNAGRLVELENSEKRTVEYTMNGGTAREQIDVTSRIEINAAPREDQKKCQIRKSVRTIFRSEKVSELFLSPER